jgi:SNF2 family DNA or RNA helicase
VYYIVCKNTIDEKVMSVLKKKDEMAQTVLDNGIKGIELSKAKEFILALIGA